MSQTSAHVPHLQTRILLEVGTVVGLFGLALACMACTLNSGDPRSTSGPSIRRCWRKFRRRVRSNPDDDDDESSYIGDNETGRPTPHIFETLNELIFFESPDDDDEAGFLATPIRSSTRGGNDDGSDEENKIKTTNLMEELFPDLLGGSTTPSGNTYASSLFSSPETHGANDSNDTNLREPLL